MSWSCEVPPSPVSPDPVGLSLRLAWPCWCSQVFWWLPALRGSSLCWAQSTWENGMARSAPGLCLGQRCLNQEEFSIQIKCPGLSSLVALCPSAQGEKLPLQCLCSRVSEGLRAAPSSWKAALQDGSWGGIFLIPHPERVLWDKKSTKRCSTFSRKTAGATNWLLFFVSCHQGEQLTQVPAFVPRVACQPVNGIADLLPFKSMSFCATKCQ